MVGIGVSLFLSPLAYFASSRAAELACLLLYVSALRPQTPEVEVSHFSGFTRFCYLISPDMLSKLYIFKLKYHEIIIPLYFCFFIDLKTAHKRCISLNTKILRSEWIYSTQL